ncbi:MAG: hypothetical protein OWR52_14370 [Acidibacillus sp.]|nr:hypothetical protein [Acidibacillus sp.]
MTRTYKQRQKKPISGTFPRKPLIDLAWLKKQERKIASGHVDIMQRALHSIEKHQAYLLIAPTMEEYIHIQFPFWVHPLLSLPPPCTHVQLVHLPSLTMCDDCRLTFCSKKVE